MNRRINIPSRISDIRYAVDEVLALLKEIKAEESVVFDIRLSLEEALINAIKYGNRFDERLSVDIDFLHNDNKVTITVEDKGGGFDYNGIPDPTKEDNLLKSKGRGIFLIRHLMDNVEYNEKGNRIIMTKYLRKENSPTHKGR